MSEERKTRHTPGPWTLEVETPLYDETTNIYIQSNHKDYGGGYIGAVYCTNQEDNSIEKANAALIAAAPELFGMLKAIHPVLLVLLNDFYYMREKCKELGMNWTLKTGDCFQYRQGKALAEEMSELIKKAEGREG